ncbi:MAG TPA: VOC family protein [Candidatus Acidoferrales bacterium]
MKRLTPVLVVEAIEPVIPFWVDRLGFQKTIEVPEGDKLGFAAFEKDGIQVMYQTWASVEKDVAAMAKERRGPTFLFIEIQGFDEIRKRLEGAPTIVTDRKTFYGARETIVRDPSGHVVTFAEFAAAAN